MVPPKDNGSSKQAGTDSEDEAVYCRVEKVSEDEVGRVRRTHFAAVCVDGTIYVMGGGCRGRKLGCEKFVLGSDGQKRSWKKWKMLTHSNRLHCSATAVGNRVYVMGGISFEGLRPSCAEVTVTGGVRQRFDNIPDGPDGRCRGSACTKVGNMVFLVGGYLSTTGTYSQEAHGFNTYLRRWERLPDMPTKRAWCTAASVDNSVYVIGGTSSYTTAPSKELTVFQTDCEGWVRLQDMQQGRYEFAAVAIQRCLLVMGGKGRGSDGEPVILDTVEAYLTDIDQWISLPPLETPRAGFAAVVVSTNEILIMGGYNHQDGKMILVPHVERLTFRMNQPSILSYHSLVTPMVEESEKPTSLSVVTHYLTELRQITQRCRDSVSRSCTRIHEAQLKIRSEENLVHEEIQAHSRETRQLTERLTKIKKQVTELQKCSMQGLPYSSLTSAIDKAQTLVDDLNRKDSSSTSKEKNPPPNELLCPITLEIMEDPVITSDGMTYERHAIERYFDATPFNQQPLSPKTNQPLKSRTLIPNVAVRTLCRDYLSDNHTTFL